MLPTPAWVGPLRCSSPSPWLSPRFWLSSDGVDVGICDATRSCWASSDGGGWVFAIAVMITSRSRSANVAGFGLERRLAAWCLSCLMTSSPSTSFLSLTFLALSFSHASSSPSPLLPNLCDVASLTLEMDFRRPLKAGMKSVELGLKQLLSRGYLSN